MSQPFNFSQIPNVVIDHYYAQMSLAAQAVYTVICRHTLGWNRYQVELSQRDIATTLGITVKTAQKALTELERLQLITVATHAGKKTVITFCVDTIVNFTTPEKITIVKNTTHPSKIYHTTPVNFTTPPPQNLPYPDPDTAHVNAVNDMPKESIKEISKERERTSHSATPWPVVYYQQTFGITLTGNSYKSIAAINEDSPEHSSWKKVVDHWLDKRWNPRNISGMIEQYIQEANRDRAERQREITRRNTERQKHRYYFRDNPEQLEQLEAEWAVQDQRDGLDRIRNVGYHQPQHV